MSTQASGEGKDKGLEVHQNRNESSRRQGFEGRLLSRKRQRSSLMEIVVGKEKATVELGRVSQTRHHINPPLSK